jgi:hypothetical protein
MAERKNWLIGKISPARPRLSTPFWDESRTTDPAIAHIDERSFSAHYS